MTGATNDRLRLIGLQAENFKGLRAVEIKPRGAVTRVTGKNGAGKSSVLDAIYAVFGGKKALPSKPIRRGQEKAIVKLDLGDIIVTRRFKGEDSSVIVEAASGAQFRSPQAMLDALYAELTFDPLKFASAEPKAQLETLRGLVKLDVDLDALDGLNERDYRLRTEWNSRAKSFAERVKTVEGGVDWTIDVTPTDVSALMDQMAQAAEHNATIEQLRVTRSTVAANVRAARAEAQNKRIVANRLLAEAATLEEEAERDEAALKDAAPLPEPIDVSAVRQQIDEAQKSNAVKDMQGRQREQLALAKKEFEDAKKAADDLTAAMEARVIQKQSAIAAANMPVPGLSFGAGEVLYNDVPLSQASAAERLRVSFAIAVAQNPKLRIALIRDGSLLDDDSMALIEQMAEEHDFQVFLEIVGEGACGILIRDGRVAAIDGEVVEQEPVAEVVSA